MNALPSHKRSACLSFFLVQFIARKCNIRPDNKKATTYTIAIQSSPIQFFVTWCSGRQKSCMCVCVYVLSALSLTLFLEHRLAVSNPRQA